jgi:LysR family transcriptional regulator, glycine cleavage system transcriptional activator
MVSPARLPSLSSIRAFEAAARHGGFAAAARELGTTAASVSYHVRQLEDQIGVRLFRRLAYRVELTEPGRRVAEEATAAFDALRASFMRAAEIDNETLSVTALPTFGVSWLTPRLGRFRARCATIRIDLDLSAAPQDLTDGCIDLAIRNGHGRWPGMRAVPLFPSIFMPLCAPALREAAADFFLSEGEAQVPLLGRPDWWDLWFRALGCDRPRRFGIGLAEEHLDAGAAIAGHGITIGSPLLFRHELEAGRLVPAHDLVASDGRAFWLTYPVARRSSEKIGHFEAWLMEEASIERDASARFIEAAVVMTP